MATDDVCENKSFEYTEFNDGWRGFGLALFIIGTVAFAQGTVWWLMHRDEELLRKRSFGLMACSGVGMLMQCALGSLRAFTGFREFPCEALLIFAFCYLPVAIGPLVVRQILFINQSRFERMLAEDSATDGDDEYEFNAAEFIQGTRLGELIGLIPSLIAANRRRKAKPATRDVAATGARAAAALAEKAEGGVLTQQKKSSTLRILDVAPALSTRAIGDEEGRQRNRERRLRYFLKSGFLAFLAQLLITLVAVASVLAIALRSGSPYFGEGCVGCAVGGSDEMALLAQGLIVAISYFVLLVMQRRYPDPIGIVRELQLTFIGGIVITIGFVVTVLDPGGLLSDGKVNWLFLLSLGSIVSFLVQCQLQVWNSIRAEGRKRSASWQKNAPVTLEAVLASQELKAALKAYLVTEWSSENLLFVDVVQQYKAEYAELTSTMAAVRAVNVHLTFVADRSMLMVNISDRARRQLRATLVPLAERLKARPSDPIPDELAPAETVFDAAFEEVMALLETDSFPRFLRSQIFADVDPKRRKSSTTSLTLFGNKTG